jgi:hypothetical protein
MARYEYRHEARWIADMSTVADGSVISVLRVANTDVDFLRIANELGAEGWLVCGKDDGGMWFVREAQP